jgi:hypothetical protein
LLSGGSHSVNELPKIDGLGTGTVSTSYLGDLTITRW